MKIFQDMVLTGMKVRGTRFIPRDSKEQNLEEISSLFRSASSEVIIVAGGLESSIYERSEMISSLQLALAKGVNFKVLLGAHTLDKFYTDHPNLMRLCEQYPNQIEIYSASETPKAHFTVVDERHVFYEQEHASDEPRDVYYEYNNTALAKKLSRIFSSTIS